MTAPVIEARGLTRGFGSYKALDHIDLDIPAGRITGLIGPNGAGKTTLLRSLLGLTAYEGRLRVLGLEPRGARTALAERASFIADTAVLPSWMRVCDLVTYVEGVHPRFSRALAMDYLSRTSIDPQSRVRQLSKGMVVQVHLALAMAVDVPLLVLDEPTLGLDILYRKRFYEQLISDFHDEARTIVLSTHQIEEVEHILTDVLLMQAGRVVLHTDMQSLAEEYVEVTLRGQVWATDSLPVLSTRKLLGGTAAILRRADLPDKVEERDCRPPSLTELFLALLGEGKRDAA